MLMVMENLDLPQIVNDRRSEREAMAEAHRLAKPDVKAAVGRPRLRAVRRHRAASSPRHSLA
jgi:hypothetical protein